jgi:putative Holliday junction resolvase
MAAPVVSLEEMAPLLPPQGPLFGLDLGTKTIGIAVSDPARRFATPLTTIRRTKFTADTAALLALAAERGVAGLVLGLPVNMDGTEGPRAQATRAFARNLSRLTQLAIGLWDERLSTVAVERYLFAADMSRARRAAVVDQHAAAFILDGALARLAGLAAQRLTYR